MIEKLVEMVNNREMVETAFVIAEKHNLDYDLRIILSKGFTNGNLEPLTTEDLIEYKKMKYLSNTLLLGVCTNIVYFNYSFYKEDYFYYKYNLSNNIKLETINIQDIYLKHLDLSKNNLLKDITISQTQINYLDLSNNKELQYVSLYYNPYLEVVDLRNSKVLDILYLGNNKKLKTVFLNEKVRNKTQIYKNIDCDIEIIYR